MAVERESETSQRILAVVLDALERGGYQGVYLQEVARTARVSLATVYKLFGTRDELIVAALEQWMTRTSYADLAPPQPGESLYDGLMRLFRRVFEPWERSPRMLEAFHRARSGPGGNRLDAQGLVAVLPAAAAVLQGADPLYLEDIGQILTGLSHGLIGRYVDGTMEITEILPTLDRAVRRLTTDNAAAAAAAVVERADPATTIDRTRS
ncbi:TetR family transcriptional regulator [Nocardia sp. alder85J]|uniref:TetR family transcriptional regulator n=1 Tax=Nocardia sp. alder85J TaxID=2862949 RepID=UPI001CD358E3|nr:TetR family transcriptional regulator [Nocardia sp. alder85J]MCX4094419.1 TetR family transcriptional regulator [Nocardia sp. alder85J]